MVDFFSGLYQFSLNLDPMFYLGLIVIISFLENLFPPVPGDTFLVYVTYVFIVKNEPVLWLFIISTTISTLGMMLIYAIGRHWGRQFFYEKNYSWMPVVFLDKVSEMFRKYGMWVIVFSRYMPGMRSVIGLFTGISNVRPLFTWILVTISTIAWNGTLIGLGLYLGNNWDKIELILRHNYRSVLALLGFFVLVWVTRRALNIKDIKRGR